MRVAPVIVLASLAACWSETAKPPVAPAAPHRFVPAPARPSSGLARTMWIVTDSDNDTDQFFFMDGGALHYKTNTGFWKNGTWAQTGNDIYIEMNERYAEYKGTIVDRTMSGDAWNRGGHQWTWTAEKSDDFPYPAD